MRVLLCLSDLVLLCMREDFLIEDTTRSQLNVGLLVSRASSTSSLSLSRSFRKAWLLVDLQV